MFVSRSNLINSQSFGNSTFDSINITNASIALDIYDTLLNSIFRVDASGGGTVTASNLTVIGSIALDDGLVGDPALSFKNSPTTGIYYTGVPELSGEFSLVSNGSDMIKMNDVKGVSILREIIMNDAVGTGAIKINSETLVSNVSIGYGAGNSLIPNVAVSNILLGALAGASITTGNNNICIGSDTGSMLSMGSNNILIGDGASVDDLSDKLVVRNITNTLLSGDFLDKSLYFDAGISNPVNTVDVGTYLILESDYVIRCTHIGGVITLNLPVIVVDQSRTLIIINESASSINISTDSSGGFIDDGTTTSFLLSNQYDRVVLRSNGVVGGIWYTM